MGAIHSGDRHSVSLFALSENTSYKTPEWNPRTRRIVSVDGEGSEIDGRHAYTLIAVADDREFSDYLEHDGSQRPMTQQRMPNHGLRTRAIFEFLLNLPRDRDKAYGKISTLYISFAFVYDATKILTDLPIAALEQIARTESAEWAGYRIKFPPRQYLVITDLSKRRTRSNGRFEYP